MKSVVIMKEIKMKKKIINYDYIIQSIMENESAGKNLNDEQYTKVIDFYRTKFIDFVLNSFFKNNINYFNKNKIEKKIILFCTDLLREFNPTSFESQINILIDMIDISYKNLITKN